MSVRNVLVLIASHGVFAAVGFAAGIYALPLLIAPEAPTTAEVTVAAAQASYSATFRRDLRDSDMLHWGEGTVSIGQDAVTLKGELSPGPDYKLYLSPEFVETEADFLRLKPTMALIGDIRTFENFVVTVPRETDITAYTAVIVWCESFGQFITAAQYQDPGAP